MQAPVRPRADEVPTPEPVAESRPSLRTDLAAQAALLRRLARRHWPAGLVALAGVAFDVAFTVWYVGRERTVYTWDSVYHWKTAIGLTDTMWSTTRAALTSVLTSVRHDEYNLLTAAPFTVPLRLFGESRLTYILSIVLLYLVPAAAMLAVLALRVTRGIWPSHYRRSWILAGLFVLIATNPVILIPVVLGFPDVVGLVPLAGAFLVYTKRRLNLSLRAALAIAVLLLAATLLRRWYLMGAAGAFVAMGADQAYLAVRGQQLGPALRRLAVVATVPLTYGALFAVVAWPYVHQLLVTDYAAAYSSFKVHDGYLDLAGQAATQHFGLLYLAPVIVGWFVLALTRQPSRVAGLVVVGAAVVSFFVVGRIQTFSSHHYYLLTPAVLVGLAAAVAGVCRRAPQWTVAAAGTLVLYAALFVGAYHPVTIGGLAPRATAPIQRSDPAELVRLYDDLAARQEGMHSIYVLVCSDRLNKSVLLDLPLALPTSRLVAPSAWMPSPDLDLRDGFNHAFFNARWVVDGDPPGYIAADPTHQSIVTLLHAAVQPGGVLGDYYRVRMTYRVEGGQAILLERTSDVPPAVRELVLDKVRALHSGAVVIW